jgi:hypothetical protein
MIMMISLYLDRAVQIEWSVERILNWSPVSSHCFALEKLVVAYSVSLVLRKITEYSLKAHAIFKKIHEYIQMRRVSETTTSEKLH